jgi:hypothetical protein
MDFRRSGPLDERRRRVLMDEIASPADADNPEAASTAAKGPVRAYHEAVLNQRQPKVTDLLPVRPLGIFALLFLGIAGIAGIEAIHVHVAALKLDGAAAQLASLDARQRGSLDDWFASALLAAAGTLSLVVFGIRSHRVDDYRGHYRIWLWTAAALVWLSLDAATGIHDAVGYMGVAVFRDGVAVGRAANHGDPASLAARATLTWIAVYTLILGGLGLRLAFEVFSSRLATIFLFVAALLYTTAALLQLHILTAPTTLTAGLAESTIILLAHFSLLSAIGFNARHVLLDARGRLKVHIDPDRRHKSKRASKPRGAPLRSSGPVAVPVGQTSTSAKPLPESADRSRFASSSGAATKPAVSISKSTVTSPTDDEDEEDDADGEYANLSRSERRRLKKLARREQRRAA